MEAVRAGDPAAADDLLPLVYGELRRLAARKMTHEPEGHTLQATALVHEAWLRLAGANGQRWDSRAHFFAAAGEAMRRILVECARRKRRLKRGGELARVNLDEVDLPLPLPGDELLALDEALERLTAFNPRAAEVIKLCFFVGLTRGQAARELGVSVSTVERLWAFARAWLYEEMRCQRHPGAAPNVEDA